MRIIPKNTKVSTEFFKGVTPADMIVGFLGMLIIFLIAVSSLPYRGYIAIGAGFILLFLLVRIDDESNYMFIFRIIRHFSYYRSYQKAGFKYPPLEEEAGEEMEIDDNQWKLQEAVALTPETSSDVAGDMLVIEGKTDSVLGLSQKEQDALQLELEGEGFEILHLESEDEGKIDSISEIEFQPELRNPMIEEEAPQSV